ncbi:MAG: NINE protein [Desulfatibacillaceae bacterium]
MRCEYCGRHLSPKMNDCPACGAPRPHEDRSGGQPPPVRRQWEGGNECWNCQAPVHEKAIACPSCGVRVGEDVSPKSWLATLLLCVFGGTLGLHRFYTGHILVGVIQLCTLGGLYILWIIDLILIITGVYKDKRGRPLAR